MFCYSLGLYVRTLYTRVNLINVGFEKHSTRSDIRLYTHVHF